jgi:hypothetical protein
MPVRVKAIDFLCRQFIGTQWFLHGEVQSMPEADYDAVVEFSNELYDRLVNHIDWNRVLLEAHGRCSALGHFERDHEDRHSDDRVCGESLAVALRVDDRPFYGVIEGDYGWKAAEENLARVRYDPRGWSLPDELKSMFAAWARARRKSINKHEEANA